MNHIPRIAIIDENTLEALGLKSMIDGIIPKADVSVFATFSDMELESETPFAHYFVSAQQLLPHSEFFLQHQHTTIVLTSHPVAGSQLEHFHMLNVDQLEHELIKALLHLHHRGHARPDGSGYQYGPFSHAEVMGGNAAISKRESEVLALLVKGCINKEIADQLNISLATVISHRKNICEKLNLKSVSALTIYAVTHGIVRIEDI